MALISVNLAALLANYLNPEKQMKYIRILVIAALLSVSFNSYSFAQSNQKSKQQNNQNDTPEAFVRIFSSYVGGLSDTQKAK